MTKREPPRNSKVYDRATQPLGPRRPAPPDASADEVWNRVDALVVEEIPSAPVQREAPKRKKRSEARRAQRRRRVIRLLDVIATVYWLGLLVKLFVADVDRALVQIVAPESAWMLDLRWAVAITLLALVLVLFRRGTIALSFAYIAAFPLVLIFWKLPKLLLKRQSPMLAAMLASLVVTAIMRARRVVCALALTVLSTLVIMISDTPQLVGIAVAAFLITLCWSVTMGCIELVRSSRSLAVQRKVIEWVLASEFLDKILAPKHPNKISVKDWSVDDAKGYRDAAGMTVLVHDVARLWAHALDQFRRGPFVVLLNVAAIVGLFVQVVFVFLFVTFGLVELVPDQYAMPETASWWTYVYYAASSCWFGEIAALQPIGPIAIAAKFANGVIGALGLGVVVVSILIGYRSMRHERGTTDLVRLLDTKAEDLDEYAKDEYALGIEELRARLAVTAWAFLGLVEWLRSRMPERS